MFQYRVTKYNPAFRNPNGAYQRDEWISYDEIGTSFEGKILTLEDYEAVESAYIASALNFLRESGIKCLRVDSLENHGATFPFSECSLLSLDQIGAAARPILRGEFWCRFESEASFLHFGYDYYMYVGVPILCPESIALATRMGLFVEDFCSPYARRQSSQ